MMLPGWRSILCRNTSTSELYPIKNPKKAKKRGKKVKKIEFFVISKIFLPIFPAKKAQNPSQFDSKWQNQSPQTSPTSIKIHSRPFTFNNLKFDLRIYVLVAGCDPLRIYLYRDGLVRFATEQYKKANKQNKGDRYMHLTNFAINKTNPNFTRSQTEKEDRKSHKRSIRDFFTELRENGVKIDACWREIKKIVVKTLCSIQPILKHNYHAIQCDDPFNHGCFELLGFDILIDKNLKPYLLEVNHSPSFSADSQVDKKVKGGLIFDALNMLGVSVKTRSKLKKMKKSHLQQRTITGRRIKLNQGELRERCLKEKDDYMFEMRGCFERIFPAEGDDVWEPYDQFLERADQIYKEFTGGELVRIERRRVVSNIRIASPSKKHEALEKIYGYKSKKRRRKRVVEKPKDSRGENASFSEEQSPRNSQRTRVGGSRLVGFEKLKSTENHKKGGYSRSSTKDQPNSGATKAGYQPKYNSSSRSNLGNKIYLRTSKASKQHSSSKDISSSRFSDSYESTKQAKNREKYGPSQVILEEPEYREENQSQDVLAKSKESSQTGHNGRKPHHRVKIRYPNVKKSSKRPEAVYKMSRSFQPKIRQLSNRRVETKFTQSRETVLDPLKVNSRIVSLRLKGMKAKSPMEGAPGASSDKNGEISLGSHKAIHGPNYSSKSLVPQQRGKRGLRYSQKTSYESKMEKNKKYLVSPYINVDPFLSFNKNYREKMKALGVKLYRDKKLGKAFVSGVAITGKAVGGGAGAASDPLRAVEGDGSGSKS